MDSRGVTARGDSIRIDFRWKGIRHRETLKLPPTKKNLAYATQLRGEIVRKIGLGTFDLKEYFPESGKIQSSPDQLTFEELSELWLDGQAHLALSTKKEYQGMLNRYWLPAIGAMKLSEISHLKLLEVIGKQEWSVKTRNNALTPLKAVLDMAHMDGLIEVNPSSRLKAAKTQKTEPDPFSLEEVEVILEWMNREPQWRNYFEFAFFTGIRTSELIALRWADVDFRGKSVRVDKAKVRREVKSTKTNTIRDVELSSRALTALENQKPFTFMRSAELFLHPYTGEPIVDDRPPRLFWTSALKACGLRHRDAYQTRHTCLSAWLMAGANPMWVAKQAGHSSPQQTFKSYARWIARADAGKEMAKFEQVLGSIPKPGIELKSGSQEEN